MGEKCQGQCKGNCSTKRVNDVVEYIRSLSYDDQVIIFQKLMELLDYKDTNVQ